ncbi:WLM domain-containing protein [Cladorrhinum sp. PSN259]|nr:WLM domain-containing protein [Cladorrhinum sp. PSN259]
MDTTTNLPPPPPPPPSNPNEEQPVSINIKFPPESHNQPWTLPSTATFSDLLAQLSATFPSYDWTKSKALIEKKPPSLKKSILLPTPADSSFPLSHLNSSTLRLLAPASQALSDLTQAKQIAEIRSSRRAPPANHRPSSNNTIHTISSPSAQQYTFHLLRPLPNYSNPSTALSLLTKLKNDPGIQAVMSKDKLTVGLLTEMDPLANTAASHSGVSRILGLNRNKGEVIELRLRTDDYAGFRDYKTIRKTLCHELAHNTHSEHDAQFWALTRRYEREVERVSDTGKTISGEGYRYGYERDEGSEGGEEEVCDHGGWTGGEYVLGRGGGSIGGEGEGEMTSREVRARAAEARLKKARDGEEADRRRGAS